MIKINHVHKYFGHRDQIHVLNDINITFPTQGLIAILGHSGSGKTTLLNILGGLDVRSKGEIELLGKTMPIQSESAWRKIRSQKVGYIFQNYHLLSNLSVYENVALPLRLIGYKDEKDIEQRVLYMLEKVGMERFKNRLATQLSGGQMQRVAIARALVKNPDVILADEPTGNLDSKHSYQIMNIIESIAKEKLVILVSHEKHLVKHYADRIIEVKDGHIIQDEMNEKSPFEFIDENILFVDEFNHDLKMDDTKWKLDVYSDDREPKKPYRVRLLMRNNTLFLDLGRPIKNVKLVHQDPSIQIVEEAKLDEIKAEKDAINFDLEILKHPDKLSFKPVLKSRKQRLKETLFGLINMPKKTKIMAYVLALMGLTLAVSVSFLSNAMSDRTIYASDHPNLIILNNIASNGQNYRLLESIQDADDTSFFINVFGSSRMEFEVFNIRPQQPSALSIGSFVGNLGITRHLHDHQILYGKMPVGPDEIAIDIRYFIDDQKAEYSFFKKLGIWSAEDLLNRRIKNRFLPDRPFIITAVVDTGAKSIYADEMALSMISSNDNRPLLPAEMFYDDANFRLIGKKPKAFLENNNYYQVLISESMASRLGILDYDFEASDRGYEVDFNVFATGYYAYDGNLFIGSDNMLLPYPDISFRFFQLSVGSRQLSIISERPEYSMHTIRTLFRNSHTTWPYQEAVNEGRTFLLGLQSFVIIGILIIVISFAGVYFMLRASTIERTYEMSIYRAIGFSRFHLMRKHLYELVALLLTSYLISYGLSTYIIYRVQIYLMGKANYFYVTIQSFMTGILVMFLLGFVGIIPLVRLLRKTPAELLSQYDM